MNRYYKKLGSGLLRPAAAAFDLSQSRIARLWNYTLLSRRLGTPLDPSVVVLGLPEIHGTRNIRLGKDLYLYRDLYWETRESGLLTIGDRVVISRGTHIVAYDQVFIGDGTMIGEYASIRDANHRYEMVKEIRESGHDCAPIRIGRQVWIGRGATILPGVTIGDHAVVGANAVVTRDVPAGTVVAGVPAKAIREEFSHANERTQSPDFCVPVRA